MTWHKYSVEVWSLDERDGAAERLMAELLRALEYRFGGVTVDRMIPVGEWGER